MVEREIQERRLNGIFQRRVTPLMIKSEAMCDYGTWPIFFRHFRSYAMAHYRVYPAAATEIRGIEPRGWLDRYWDHFSRGMAYHKTHCYGGYGNGRRHGQSDRQR